MGRRIILLMLDTISGSEKPGCDRSLTHPGSDPKALQMLSRDEGAVYKPLWSRGERLRAGLEDIFRERKIPVTTSGGGPVFQLSFMDTPARNYGDTLKADMKRYSDFGVALFHVEGCGDQ